MELTRARGSVPLRTRVAEVDVAAHDDSELGTGGSVDREVVGLEVDGPEEAGEAPTFFPRDPADCAGVLRHAPLLTEPVAVVADASPETPAPSRSVDQVGRDPADAPAAESRVAFNREAEGAALVDVPLGTDTELEATGHDVGNAGNRTSNHTTRTDVRDRVEARPVVHDGVGDDGGRRSLERDNPVREGLVIVRSGDHRSRLLLERLDAAAQGGVVVGRGRRKGRGDRGDLHFQLGDLTLELGDLRVRDDRRRHRHHLGLRARLRLGSRGGRGARGGNGTSGLALRELGFESLLLGHEGPEHVHLDLPADGSGLGVGGGGGGEKELECDEHREVSCRELRGT